MESVQEGETELQPLLRCIKPLSVDQYVHVCVCVYGAAGKKPAMTLTTG